VSMTRTTAAELTGSTAPGADLAAAAPRSAPPPVAAARADRGRGGWLGSYQFRLGLALHVVVLITTWVAAGATLDSLVAELVLVGSAYVSLLVLSDRPFLNPVQMVAALFFWWFGVGPIATALADLLQGSSEQAKAAFAAPGGALWLTAFGLPVYALAARWTLRRLEDRQVAVRFLLPAGHMYRPRTLVIAWAVGAAAGLSLAVFEIMGVKGLTATNYLGGLRTDVWYVGIANAVGSLRPIATAAVLFMLAWRWRECPLWLVLFGGAVTLQTIVVSLTSGFKGDILLVFLYFACGRFSLRQRAPFFALAALTVLFLCVVEPFVTYTRLKAEALGVETPSGRELVFREALRGGALGRLEQLKNLRVWLLFRGIPIEAGEVVRETALTEGVWKGATLRRGLEILIPRSLWPAKGEYVVGNLFARTIGAKTGVMQRDDYVSQIALTVPFEVVINFGWAAGVIAFALLGVGWSALCGFLLSPARLFDHPLTPFFVGLAMRVEQPLGSLLGSLRDLALPLLVLFVLSLILGRRL
jgi:hypothetical protein